MGNYYIAVFKEARNNVFPIDRDEKVPQKQGLKMGP
jgi:hypothetical protein